MSCNTKKLIVLFLFITLCCFACADGFKLWAQDAAVGVQTTGVHPDEDERVVPLALEGIWENYNRYVVFDTGYLSEHAQDASIPQIVLRMFYQWYDDRAAESSAYTQKENRDRNDTTDAPAVEMSVTYVPLTYEAYSLETGVQTTLDNGDVLYASETLSGAWDIQIVYAHDKTVYHVPVAVIGNKLYLNFIVKNLSTIGIESSNDQLLNGYWRDWGRASGILISPPYNEKEMVSYFVTDDAVYYIRYWRTDMEFDDGAVAVFSDGSQSFEVPKHLRAQGQVYTCVNGRGSKIRNITKSNALPEEMTLNQVTVLRHGTDADGNEITWLEKAATICALGEPYLTLTDGTRTIEQIVTEANARRKPDPPPLFPPHGILDFDWSIVDRPPQNWFKRNSQLGK